MNITKAVSAKHRALRVHAIGIDSRPACGVERGHGSWQTDLAAVNCKRCLRSLRTATVNGVTPPPPDGRGQ
jgi:hypothetical protein